MTVFEAKNYVDYVRMSLRGGLPSRPRGMIKAVAQSIGCHSTFISQVLSGRGHFSHEQALLFCSHFKLSEEESEFFIDLLNRDRAGTSEASLHFQRIINRKILERRSFQKRNRLQSVLRENQEVKYLASWIPSAVYGAVHISELQTAKKLSDYLNIDTRVAEETLASLQGLGLVSLKKDRWVPTEHDLHISKDSAFAGHYHGSWRLKTASRLAELPRTIHQTHYSSVFAISNQVAEEIREVILRNLTDIRKKMVSASSEQLFVLCLDFYPIYSQYVDQECKKF